MGFGEGCGLSRELGQGIVNVSGLVGSGVTKWSLVGSGRVAV